MADTTPTLREAAQQAAERSSEAYDKIDRFLRNNLDDADYAEFSAALDAMCSVPAAEQAGAIPAGWVPLRMEWEPGYPEDVAFGPPMMMERLKKWLDKHFAARVAEANAEQAEPVAVPAGYALVPVEPTEAMLSAIDMTHSCAPIDQWRAAIAAAPPAPARQEWQPIETAPRDGTAFRGFHESLIDLDFNPCGSVECAWDGEQFIGCVWNGQQDAWYGKPVDLSHWMPLPAAPITAAPAAPARQEPPADWSVFNTGAEVAGGLTYAEALEYLTPPRLERGWSAVCVVNKDNITASPAEAGA